MFTNIFLYVFIYSSIELTFAYNLNKDNLTNTYFVASP